MECILAEVKAIKQPYNSNETPIPLSRNASNAITTEPGFHDLIVRDRTVNSDSRR